MLTDKEVLLKAKEYLAKNKNEIYLTRIIGSNQFICHALTDVVKNRTLSKATYEVPDKEIKQINKLKDIINKLLGNNYSTVEDWLCNRGFINDPDKELTKVQRYRHQWLNHLASKCNSKGELTYKNARA